MEIENTHKNIDNYSLTEVSSEGFSLTLSIKEKETQGHTKREAAPLPGPPAAMWQRIPFILWAAKTSTNLRFYKVFHTLSTKNIKNLRFYRVFHTLSTENIKKPQDLYRFSHSEHRKHQKNLRFYMVFRTLSTGHIENLTFYKVFHTLSTET